MKKEDFEKQINSYMNVDMELRRIADTYADKFEGGGYVDGIEVEFDGVLGTVEVTGSIPSHCGCCSDDYMEFRFPLRYLWEEDWVEQIQAERDLEQRKREEAKKLKAKEQKKRNAEGERKLYEKLKAKYE